MVFYRKWYLTELLSALVLYPLISNVLLHSLAQGGRHRNDLANPWHVLSTRSAMQILGEETRAAAWRKICTRFRQALGYTWKCDRSTDLQRDLP
jgi:hypothetical protein